MGLLCSRLRSQQSFKMSVNVCLDDTVWITEHFVTKFGIVILNHGTFCYQIWYGDATSWARVMQKCFCSCCYLQGQGHSKGSYDKNMTLSNMLSVMTHHQKPECPLKKKGLLHLGSRSQQKIKMLMVVQMISSKSPNIVFPNLELWCIVMSLSVMQKIDLLFSRSRSL